MIKQRDVYREQIQKTNEALQAYLKELKKMRNFLLGDASGEEGDISAVTFQKKVLKYKKLESDNKKLKQLLK